MPLRRRPFVIAGAASLAALLGGCGSTDASRVDIAVIGESRDPFEKGVYLSTAGQLVRASVAEGLVAFDDRGRVIPALADSWIVTDDGQSYIFRLRDGVWPDGSELTARSAARSLRKTIAMLRSTPLGLDLAGIAEVREMAGRVIEIRLSHPAPYFLQLLAQPEMGLLHDGEGAGPMRLERVAATAVLTPIPPEERGQPEIRRWTERARTIGVLATSGDEAVRRFNESEVDLVLGGSIVTFPHTADVGILRGTIQLDPVEGLFGLKIASRDRFLAEPANREALAMAIDRAGLIAAFGVDGWKSATRIVPLARSGAEAEAHPERWADLSLGDRRLIASARVASWKQGAGGGDLDLGVWLPDGPGSDILFVRLRRDLGAIGVNLTRARKEADGELRLVDVTERYPGVLWYLNRFNCAVARGVCSPEADTALASARKAADPAERDALIAEAERLLDGANVFIPFGSPIRWSLVRGDAVGFAVNSWGWHPLMPMALLPR